MAPRRASAQLAALLAVLTASVGCPCAAGAQTLTWALDPALSPEALERIEGQTLDLPFTRLTTRPPASDARRHAADGGDPLARAAWIAAGSGARVVIWAQARGSSLELTIVDLEARRVLVREVRAESGQELSAALETVALIVRSALQALAEGGDIGVRQPSPQPSQEEAGGDTVLHAAPGRRDGPEVDPGWAGGAPPEGLPRERMLGAALVLRQLVSGGVAPGGVGLLALRHGRLWLGTALGASLRGTVRAPSATIRVALVGAALDLGVVALQRAGFVLVPVAGLGVGRLRRETERVGEGLVRTGSRTHVDVRLSAGSLARLALGDVAWLTLDVRIELPLARVRYTILSAGDAVLIARTPRVAPVIGLGVVARVGRAR